MTSTGPASSPELEAAKAALARRDRAEARRLLSPVVARPDSGLAPFLLARTEFEDGNLAEAERLLDGFLTARPRHQRARMLRARLYLANGQTAEARQALDALLADDSPGPAAERLREQVEFAEAADVVRKNLAVIEEGYLTARCEGASDAMREAARTLSAIPPGPDWNNDVAQAKVAFFRFAPDLDMALRNYDPHLIEMSVEFDYVTWPRKIQQWVTGKSVLDVGCGFGGYGMGFLVAGATEYVGLDPVMNLDSTRAKNKRTRTWSDMGVTPREIEAALPAIRLFQGTSEDLHFDETFDTIALHNVTEHLMQLDLVFEGLTRLCKPETRIVFLHHNFYCWNGHHLAPNRPDQLDPENPRHAKLYDWRHIALEKEVPDEHYFKTNLNRVRLDEIRAITERHFRIITWEERPSSKATLERLTPGILERVRRTVPDIQERELKTNVVFCVACLR